MIILSNTTAQTLAVGQSITFDTVVLQSGTGECHRANSSAIRMRYNGIYEIHFSAGVTGATEAVPVNLTIQIGGEDLKETGMTHTPATANAVGHISTTTAVRNCCVGYDRITVTNTGTTDITVSENPVLFVKRIA